MQRQDLSCTAPTTLEEVPDSHERHCLRLFGRPGTQKPKTTKVTSSCPELQNLYTLDSKPKAQNGPKAIRSVVFGPKNFNYECLEPQGKPSLRNLELEAINASGRQGFQRRQQGPAVIQKIRAWVIPGPSNVVPFWGHIRRTLTPKPR